MIDKGKLEKCIMEDYEQLVFEGYSVQEISYMGTCLIRFALDQTAATSVGLRPKLERGIE